MWMAGRLLMTGVTPQIERVIKAALAPDSVERTARVSVGLDALIELGAKPADVSLLDATRRTRPVQSLILLSRMDARADPVLLSVMKESDSYAWFAAANLLKERKASGFVALLLKDLEITAEVVVSIDGKHGYGSGGGSGGVGDKAGWNPEGYPPLTDYEFRRCSGVGLSLLAAGPTDVCYAKARPVLSSHDTDGPDHDDRLALLNSEWSPLHFDAIEQEHVAWQSDAATRAALAELVARVRRRYATAIARLNERGWLTAEEMIAVSSPRIRESIRDLRSQ